MLASGSCSTSVCPELEKVTRHLKPDVPFLQLVDKCSCLQLEWQCAFSCKDWLCMVQECDCQDSPSCSSCWLFPSIRNSRVFPCCGQLNFPPSPHLPVQRRWHSIGSHCWSASLSQETKIYSEQRMINGRNMTAREDQSLMHVRPERSLPLPWQQHPSWHPQTPTRRRRGWGWVAR